MGWLYIYLFSIVGMFDDNPFKTFVFEIFRFLDFKILLIS